MGAFGREGAFGGEGAFSGAGEGGPADDEDPPSWDLSGWDAFVRNPMVVTCSPRCVPTVCSICSFVSFFFS